MKRVVKILFATAVAGICLWTAGSMYVMRNVDSPAYEVLAKTVDYEIRRYPALLVAETEADTDDDAEPLFRVLANFIFGGNEQAESIAMTAPVFMSATAGTPEAMMQFIMPAQYTAETLPEPLSDRVVIRTLPARTVAVRQFGWFASQQVRRTQLADLLEGLRRDGITTSGDPVYAGYQPPFSIPFMKRHEIMVSIEMPAS
ncbi:MAG: heme-binding protein [Pseudomonadota bacterium]